MKLTEAIERAKELGRVQMIAYEAMCTGDREACDKAIGLLEDLPKEPDILTLLRQAEGEMKELKKIISEIDVKTAKELKSMFKEDWIGVPITILTVKPETIKKIMALQSLTESESKNQNNGCGCGYCDG